MAQNTAAPAASELEASSFAKGLALGEIHEEMAHPYPIPRDEEAVRVRELVGRFREYAAQHIDSRRIDDERWIPDHVVTDLGALGLTGLYVPERYGGQGLSQTGYARVFEAFGQVDGSLTVALGVHQSIGMKGIVLFGSDEQKARLLPLSPRGGASPASRSPSPRRARTPRRSARARCGSPTAPGCSTARSAGSGTAGVVRCSSPSRGRSSRTGATPTSP